ncbi:MAG: hypothetical protein R3Y43_06405 [Alphaproteobacteria bacterium]
MKKMIALFVLFLASCVHQPSYEEQIAVWQGQNVEYLYNEWGMPETTQPLANGGMLLVYTQTQEQTVPQQVSIEQEVSGNAPSFAGSPFFNTQNTYFCSTTFTVENGIITGYSFEGDNCN